MYCFCTCGMFYQIQLDGVKDAVFVQQLRTEKQTGNVASAKNGCARAAVLRQFK
jgi:hypothetical protein